MVTVSTSAVQERKKVSLPIDLPPVWSEQEQLEHAADLVVEGNFTRWDPRFVDILPALLSQRERPWAIGPFSNGDSYGVLQSIHLEESLRWVPASSEMHALPLRAWHG